VVRNGSFELVLPLAATRPERGCTGNPYRDGRAPGERGCDPSAGDGAAVQSACPMPADQGRHPARGDCGGPADAGRACGFRLLAGAPALAWAAATSRRAGPPGLNLRHRPATLQQPVGRPGPFPR